MLKKIILLYTCLIGMANAECKDGEMLQRPVPIDLDAPYIHINLVIAYSVNLNLTGDKTQGQTVYYDVKDLAGNQIIHKTKLDQSNNAFWSVHINDITHYQGQVPNNEFILTLYGLSTKYTDKNGKQINLSTAIPIHIAQNTSSITATPSNENDPHEMNTCRDFVTINGSLGIKLSTLLQSAVNVSINDSPSEYWNLITKNTVQNNYFDKNTDMYYDTKPYSVSSLGNLNNNYPWNQEVADIVNINITTPYIQEFISPKNMQQPAEYTFGYQFHSN